MMAHAPFDYCDDCGGRFGINELEKLVSKRTGKERYLCKECWDEPWHFATKPSENDNYDRITKNRDDK